MSNLRGFDRALPHVLVHEGGKVDHPKDPGGRTNKGVTQRVYNAWRGKSHLPMRDVYLIDDLEVAAIYRFQYWEAVMGDRLPEGVGYVVFDGAVNSGPKQSIKWLQRALGSLYTGKVDGVMGTITLDAVSATNDMDELIARVIDRRDAFLRALKTWPTFGKGWSRRIAQVEQTGQAWASGSVGSEPTFVGGNEKASIEDAKAPPPKGAADGATGAGAGAGGIAVVLQQAQEQLTPYSAAGGWIQNLVVFLIIAGALLAIGGFAFRAYAKRKQAKLDDALDPDPVAA
ncbi:glycoside hydrolase family 108 protein [Devosia naphthalenivorans]|uniref:glycoside hydrolase family 108 protein n=1 Tax=Devosia naphthalenivorans TaxID=2082392 RepID=UPI000D3C32AA|nr:glycoside hydrolase family 108 protein [Devosia naphthalenivorans]